MGVCACIYTYIGSLKMLELMSRSVFITIKGCGWLAVSLLLLEPFECHSGCMCC